MAHTIDEDTKKIVKAIVHGDQKRQSRRRAVSYTHLDVYKRQEFVLLPEAVHINDGETGLTVKHEEKPRKAATK